MTPASDINLLRFLSAFEREKEFQLVAAVLDPVNQRPVPIEDHALLKTELVVRPAWEIGRHDEDFIVIGPDDDPIIPAGVDKPPVLEAIAARKAMREKGG
jgi:hypothetical protein